MYKISNENKDEDKHINLLDIRYKKHIYVLPNDAGPQFEKVYNKSLVEKYPFLLPRNVLTDEVVENYDYSYTLLDDIEEGWRIAFGISLCAELKEALLITNHLEKFRFTQIKEKYGRLCLYNFNCSEQAIEVIRKYENMSETCCVKCGEPATQRSLKWVCPWCDECAKSCSQHETFITLKSDSVDKRKGD